MAHIKNEKLLIFRKKSVELVTYKSKNIITYEMTYVYLDYLIPVKAGAKYIFTNISRLFFFLHFHFLLIYYQAIRNYIQNLRKFSSIRNVFLMDLFFLTIQALGRSKVIIIHFCRRYRNVSLQMNVQGLSIQVLNNPQQFFLYKVIYFIYLTFLAFLYLTYHCSLFIQSFQSVISFIKC